MQVTVPRMLVAGLRGGSGKTLVSLGLAAAWTRQDMIVAPFKKGPDYIDASWLTRATGRPCRNLDQFLIPAPLLVESFRTGAQGADLSIIEGNRGLFDGMDAEGSTSSAELAKLLEAPAVLVVDVTKTTRTAATMVLGCQTMDPDLRIGGVILNRCAGARHESVSRASIEEICGIPVLGALPKLKGEIFPERHLGLVPPQETEEAEDPLARVAQAARDYLDLDRILDLVRSAGGLEGDAASQPTGTGGADYSERVPVDVHSVAEPGGDSAQAGTQDPARIGVFRDAAFQFYYPENLEALESSGGELVEISPLQDPHLPQVDALYLGGGFPETLALGLSENQSFSKSVLEAARGGMPIYAECGGAVYLGEKLHYQGREYSMTGVLPVEYGFQSKPQGHGYSVIEAVAENPFFSVGETLKGHEFHYTHVVGASEADLKFAFRIHRGYGFDGKRDGLCRWNVLAAYTHLHALGSLSWAPGLVRVAAGFRTRIADRPIAEPGS